MDGIDDDEELMGESIGGGVLKRANSKRMTKGLSRRAVAEDWTLYHKGAAELVLEKCSFYLDADGNEQALTDSKRASFQKVIREFARGALRCVALAHRSHIQGVIKDNLHEITLPDVEKKLENKMCLDALVGIADPLRADVIEAVATCQRAGIFVRMVTGDNLETAIAIAKEAGILKPGTYNSCLRCLKENETRTSAHFSDFSIAWKI